MRAAASHPSFLDNSAAVWTWLAFTAENTSKLQITAFIAIGIDIIAIGAAAVVETDLQTVFDGLMETLELDCTDLAH